MIHFVGFRGEEYTAAMRVWGRPDFIHRVHDKRMRREVAAEDTIVFGPAARPEELKRNGDDIREKYL